MPPIPFDLTNAPDDVRRVIEARHAVMLAFAAEKGKAPEDFTIEEILECRRRPEWQNAGRS